MSDACINMLYVERLCIVLCDQLQNVLDHPPNLKVLTSMTDGRTCLSITFCHFSQGSQAVEKCHFANERTLNVGDGIN